jgi:hypothetical protein
VALDNFNYIKLSGYIYIVVWLHNKTSKAHMSPNL